MINYLVRHPPYSFIRTRNQPKTNLHAFLVCSLFLLKTVNIPHRRINLNVSLPSIV